MVRLNAKELRSYRSSAVSRQTKHKIKKQEIYIVLDNVLDTYNIGSIFRLADAVSVKRIYLCGQTEIPPNHRIKKASINTTEWVDWEYCATAIEAIEKVRNEWKRHPVLYACPKGIDTGSINNIGIDSRLRGNDRGVVVAIEQSPKSIPYDKFEYKMPIALVVGHESDGVSKEVLEISDAIVELPMFGVNKSLNVMVSLGIVLYEVIGNTYNKKSSHAHR